MPDYYFYMIVGRDLLILLGGIFVTIMIGKVLPSDYLGKATVLAVSFVLLTILLNASRESLLYLFLYYVSIVLIFASLTNYLIKAYRVLATGKKI